MPRVFLSFAHYICRKVRSALRVWRGYGWLGLFVLGPLVSSAGAQPASNEAALAPVGWVSLIIGEPQALWASADPASPSVSPARRRLKRGDPVYQGDRLLTGAGAHLHIRTVDDGLLALRPDSQAMIEVYEYKPEAPGATRIRLVLDSGVMRAASGKGAQAARERFRLNTPVAAVGIRGTDFTASATSQVTRVVVQSGAVVLSAFGTDCLRDALGPCGGSMARVLSAEQAGKLLELRRGDAEPQLLELRQGAVPGAGARKASPAEVVAAASAVSTGGPAGGSGATPEVPKSVTPATSAGTSAGPSSTAAPVTATTAGATPSQVTSSGAGSGVVPTGVQGHSPSVNLGAATSGNSVPAAAAAATGVSSVSGGPAGGSPVGGIVASSAPVGSLSQGHPVNSLASVSSTGEVITIAAVSVSTTGRLPDPTQAPLVGQVTSLASEARNGAALQTAATLGVPMPPVAGSSASEGGSLPASTEGSTNGTSSVSPAPANTTPASTTPASTTPASTTPASTTPASTTPAGTTPAGTTPAGTTPAGTTPAGTTPAGTTPASTTPASTTPGGTTPAGTTPANTTPPSTTLPVGAGGSTTGSVTGNISVAPVPEVQPLPAPAITWGRWAAFAGSVQVVDTNAFRTVHGPFAASNGAYVLSVSNGGNLLMPVTGVFDFKLTEFEAFETQGAQLIAPATVQDGRLSVDFGARRFSTTLDLGLSSGTTQFSAQGRITREGRLEGELMYASPKTNMNVRGQLAGQNAGSAAYLFDAPLGTGGRGVIGVTRWSR